MPSDGQSITSAVFHAYFIFDVADTIDLTKLVSIAGKSAERAPLRLRATPSPGHIQFAVPPLAAPLPPINVGANVGSARSKIYDFGVVSVRFSFPYSGPWSGFADLTIALRKDDALAGTARRILHDILADCAPALDDPHEALLEDYFIYTVENFAAPVLAADLLAGGAPALASLLMAETSDLGLEEQREVLRLHFGYFPDDLIVVQWDSAFVYDSRENAEVIEDILEFANSQLVEFRTYDARLDAELDAIYATDISHPQPPGPLRRRAADRRAEQLRYLLVDIRELADRASNALKIIGDAYYARIYRAIAARLSLDDWQRQVDSKLDSVGEVYRFLIDQAQTARSEFLELIVILLIAIEIVVGVIGLRR
jgi:hypothetical protein